MRNVRIREALESRNSVTGEEGRRRGGGTGSK